MARVNESPRGVGGWLLLLSGLLRFGEPINVAVMVAAALTALPIRGTPLALVLLLRLAVAALGIAAGRAPRAAASSAARSTASRPFDESGRRGSTSGPTASPW